MEGASAIRDRSLLPVHLMMLLVTVTWGSNFVSIKYLLRSIDPIDLVVLRLPLASLFFVVVLLAINGRRLPRFDRADWPRLLLVSMLGITIVTVTVSFGTRLIPAALASMIMSSNPIFTAILSRILGGERLTHRKIGGIALASIGFVIVLLWGGPEAKISVNNVFGVLLTMTGPLCWAGYTVVSKPLLRRYQPVEFAGVITIVGTLPLLSLAFVDASIFSDVTQFTGYQWLATLTMSLFALVLGYTLWYRGLRVFTPTQVTVYLYLVPVFGIIAARLFLGERITIYLLLGGVTILAGVILTNSSRAAPVDQPEAPTHTTSAPTEPDLPRPRTSEGLTRGTGG